MITIKIWFRGGGDTTFQCMTFKASRNNQTGRFSAFNATGMKYDMGIVADDVSAWRRIR